MKYLFAAFLTLTSFSSFAQNEQWDYYIARFGDKPGYVMVDMNLYNTAPDKKFPNLVITGPRGHNCNANGLPGKEETAVLEDILTATDNFITGVTAKVLTGTFTYKCERLNYYYVKDTVGIRNALGRMYNHSYKDYDYVIEIRPDPEWTSYRTFLYPDESSRNWMDNNKIITNLLLSGDSLTMKRDINYSFYFRSDTDRIAFANYAVAKGYKTDLPIAEKAAKASYPLTVSAYTYVKMDSICATTTDLKQQATLHHGFYEGWAAPLKR